MPTTEENPPLKVGGIVQWAHLLKLAKLLVAAIAVAVRAVLGAMQSYRISKAETAAKVAAAEATARQAKNASEAGFQVTKEYVTGLEHRLSVLELAAKRAQRPSRRPIPVVPTPKPKPLPADLNKAEAQVYKGVPPSVIAPPPDGGQ